jgi:hypothetical protein
MKKNSIVLATLLMCTGSALAGTGTSSAISTQELAGVCGDQSNPQPQIYCDVYGQGVYDGYLVTRHPKLAPDFICVVQPAPARRVVMNQFIDWVKQNPIYNTAPAADTLLRFLAIQFPCDTNESSPGKAVKKITN